MQVEIKALQSVGTFYSPRWFFLKAPMCFVCYFSLYGSVWRCPIEASFLLSKNAQGFADCKTWARCTAVLLCIKYVCRIGTPLPVKCRFWYQMQSGVNWGYTKPFCATSQRMVVVCCPCKQASVTTYQNCIYSLVVHKHRFPDFIGHWSVAHC